MSKSEVIFLLPEEIVVDDLLAGLRHKIDPKSEQERIEALAKTIEQEGQIQPGEVRAVKSDGRTEYHLVVGHRRRAAISLLNSRRNGQPPIKMAVTVREDLSDEAAHRRAIIENLHRKNFSPIDLALNIQSVRRRYGWTGSNATKYVAQFFMVSPAQITQHEKLLCLDRDIQDRVHKGLLSAQSAFDLVDVPVEKRDEVMAKAEELAKAENPNGKGRVKRKHILSAAREQDAFQKPKARTRIEILALFRQLADETTNDRAWDFLTYLEQWAAGEGDTDQLKALWNSLIG